MRFFLFLVILGNFLSSLSFGSSRKFFGEVSYWHSYVDYKEPGLMSEKGLLTGISGDVLYKFNNQFIFNFQGKFLVGNLEYDGATFDGDPVKQTTKDLIQESRALALIKLGNYVPYIGYGHRYWRNNLVISYVRETSYNYIPIGLKYNLKPFYVGYELKHFLYGINKSSMSDVSPLRSDVTMRQNSGRGYALEAGMMMEFKYFDTKLTLQYERWEIEDSETSNDGVDILIEPHNSTNVLSVVLGLFF